MFVIKQIRCKYKTFTVKTKAKAQLFLRRAQEKRVYHYQHILFSVLLIVDSRIGLRWRNKRLFQMVLFSLPILSEMFCAICRPQDLCGMRCVLFFCVLCERKKGPPRKKERSSVKDIILTMWTGNVKIFRRLFPSLFEKRLSMQQEEALLRSRTCPSCVKKGVFYEQEGHILECKT